MKADKDSLDRLGVFQHDTLGPNVASGGRSDACPALPEPIKAGILAMVRAASNAEE
jgi:hypothetical protein